MPPGDPFQLSIAFELTAAFLFAVTGALRAIERRYDVVGVYMLALLSAVGGGLVRDSFFLRELPLALQDARYLYVVAAATAVCLVIGAYLHRLSVLFLLADAMGLGIFGVVGTQRALEVGLPMIPAGFVGLANAIGGGVLRDVLTAKETLLFKPGEFYVMAAIIGIAVFIALLQWAPLTAREAAAWSIGTTFLIRLAAVRFNWKTSEARPLLGGKRPAPME